MPAPPRPPPSRHIRLVREDDIYRSTDALSLLLPVPRWPLAAASGSRAHAAFCRFYENRGAALRRARLLMPLTARCFRDFIISREAGHSRSRQPIACRRRHSGVEYMRQFIFRPCRCRGGWPKATISFQGLFLALKHTQAGHRVSLSRDAGCLRLPSKRDAL